MCCVDVYGANGLEVRRWHTERGENDGIRVGELEGTEIVYCGEDVGVAGRVSKP